MVTKTIQPTQQVELTSDGWTLSLYGRRAAIITSPDSKRVTNYFGFDDEAKAVEFKKWIDENKYCDRSIIRKSERLICAFEVKVWKCPMWLIQDCMSASS